MLRLVMVPLDGSRFAEQALPLALGVARRSGAKLHLVAVRPSFPVDFDGLGADSYLEHVISQIESEYPGGIDYAVIRDELGALAYPPPAPDSVAGMLARHAEELHAGLVLMSTHGRGGLRRAWLGSVADALVRLSSVPVLLVKPHDDQFSIAAAADRGLDHILVPLDGSANAESALPLALELGEVFGAHYTLLRVMVPLPYTAQYDVLAGAYLDQPSYPTQREAAETYLEEIAAPLRSRGLSVATQVVQHGSAAAAIVEHAGAHAVSLIVIASSGAGRVRRLLLGSVADKVVRGADIPVMVSNVHRMAEAGEHVTTAGVESVIR
jgi:nucleotide-binding universal stress UspA family protein